MSADNFLGWDIVLKISHLPSKLRFSAKYSPEGVYNLLNNYKIEATYSEYNNKGINAEH